MGTTSLVVELLIIGFQVATWIILLMLTIFGYQWIDIKFLTDWAGLITLALIAASYPVGMVFDALLLAILVPVTSAVSSRPAELLS